MATRKKATVPSTYVPPAAVTVYLVFEDEFVQRVTDAAATVRAAPKLEQTLYVSPRQWAKTDAERAFYSDMHGEPRPYPLLFVYDATLKCGVCHGVDGFIAEHGAKAGLFSLSPPKPKRAK